MTEHLQKLQTVLSFLCRCAFQNDEISGDIYNMLFEPNYDAVDIENFITWAARQIDEGNEEPDFDEWFATIAPYKTGAPTPKHIK